MDINSQHQNLLGNQISPKSEDFCILVAIFGFKMAAIANQRWISIRNIIIYMEAKFRPNRRIFVFGGHFVLWLPCNSLHFEFFQPPPPKKKSANTLRWIFLQSLMKGIQIFFKSPLFLFPWQLRQSLSNRFRFFWLTSFH